MWERLIFIEGVGFLSQSLRSVIKVAKIRRNPGTGRYGLADTANNKYPEKYRYSTVQKSVTRYDVKLQVYRYRKVTGYCTVQMKKGGTFRCDNIKCKWAGVQVILTLQVQVCWWRWEIPVPVRDMVRWGAGTGAGFVPVPKLLIWLPVFWFQSLLAISNCPIVAFC